MKSLRELLLGGTAIKELPSSTIHLKELSMVSFKGCQLSSSSLTSMPRSLGIDLSDCNLSAIPSGICISEKEFIGLFLRGNDFVSLPESISQFSGITHLYLDGCKSLRSLSNIPSKVRFICVDNCTSLERLPEPPNDFYWAGTYFNFTAQCFNCFKLAYNIKSFSNIFQGQSRQQFEKRYIIPGREIPKWFEKVNICDSSVVSRYDSGSLETRTYKIKKVKIQLPGSGSWSGIVLCVVFLPSDLHRRYEQGHMISVTGCPTDYPKFTSEYGKVELHHLWLHSVSKFDSRLLKTPRFHQVELEIKTQGLEVEKIGFRVIPIKISEAHDEDDGEFFSSLLLPAYQRGRQTSQGFGE
nr:disease resistance-like protein csa1 [Quercus suber]